LPFRRDKNPNYQLQALKPQMCNTSTLPETYTTSNALPEDLLFGQTSFFATVGVTFLSRPRSLLLLWVRSHAGIIRWSILNCTGLRE
jgi:hypothetical protein